MMEALLGSAVFCKTSSKMNMTRVGHMYMNLLQNTAVFLVS